ncbi:MAG TPA: hypothetical protein VN867_01820 [Candidatus Binataceae bacterium]|nr:hypothetical protein [Candidatus Binataceae bacterium]
MAGDRRGWKVHDDHLRAMVKLDREMERIFAAIEKNGGEIGTNLNRIVECLGLEPSKSTTIEAFAENTSIVLAAPHNPDMTPAAIKQHHKSVEAIVKLMAKQTELSVRLNKVFKELYRHQVAIKKMFK